MLAFYILFLFFKIFIYFYKCCACVYVCVACLCLVLMEVRRALGPLELELGRDDCELPSKC